MIEWIAKYWLEVIFGLMAAGIGWTVRHHIKLLLKDKQRHEDDMLDAIDKKFDQQSIHMKEQMNECYSNLIEVVKESDEKSIAEDKIIHKEIDIIKDGMLSIEGRAFRNECRKLLNEDHTITVDEYTTILAEHTTYNNLGGNHEGDELFKMVQAKYQSSFQVKEE